MRCEVCGAEAIVITSVEPDLACCGQPMTPLANPGPAGSKPK